MTNELNLDLMVSMLRRGGTGTEMLDILNVIVPDNDVDAVVNVEDADTMEVEVEADVIVEDAELAVV